MQTRSKAWLLIAALSLIASAARSDGIGPGAFGQNTFGGIGQPTGTITPPTGCASTGIFDLSNTCNDIYFIGALK